MIQCNNVRLQFGARVLFEDVNVKFTKGNCYGIIGANGAGKSTFLKLLTGELNPSSGEIIISKNGKRLVIDKTNKLFDKLNKLSKKEIIKFYESGREVK